MGRVFEVTLEGLIYSCKHCGTHLALSDDVVSKVQRLIAASPHLLLEDSTYLARPMKSLPAKEKPLNHPVREIPYISKQKDEPEKPSHKNESSTEKASSS